MAEYKGLTAILKYFREMLIPAGTVIEYAGKELPERYLLCDGRRVLKTDYPELWKAIKHEWAMPTDTDAMKVDYFRIPDLRECATVGAGTSTSTYKNTTRVFEAPDVNPNTGTGGTQTHDPYLLGQFKDDQFQGHEHNYQYTPVATQSDDWGDNHKDVWPEQVGTTSAIVNKSGYGNVRYGTTTHGKQVGIYKIIKY